MNFLLLPALSTCVALGPLGDPIHPASDAFPIMPAETACTHGYAFYDPLGESLKPGVHTPVAVQPVKKAKNLLQKPSSVPHSPTRQTRGCGGSTKDGEY